MKKKLLILVLALAMILALAACGGSAPAPAETGEPDAAPTAPAAPTDPIEIAPQPVTEGYILGEMLGILIEDQTDYTVNITKGLGATTIIMPAMENGDFDLYPEYTSTGWILVLGHTSEDAEGGDLIALLNEEYGENYDMSWIGPYGFNDTYGLAVSPAVAEEYNLTTCSELAAVSDQLVFGANADYIERADGFPRIAEAYGLNFKDVVDIDIGLRYAALDSGEVDVIKVDTTDAQLETGKCVVLEDDLNVQTEYYAATVVRNDTLAEYPGLAEALALMNGILTEEDMIGLNYQVEVQGMDEHQVAYDYLAGLGLLQNA